MITLATIRSYRHIEKGVGFRRTIRIWRSDYFYVKHYKILASTGHGRNEIWRGWGQGFGFFVLEVTRPCQL